MDRIPGALKRWLKRISIGLGCVLLALALFLIVEHARGKSALRQRLAELTAWGERLALSDLQPKRASSENNSVPELLGISNDLASVSEQLSKFSLPSRFAAPGKAIVTSQIKEWPTDAGATNNWLVISNELEYAHDVLRTVYSAASKPMFDVGFDFQKGFVDFQTGPILLRRHVARLLSAATEYELSEGRLPAAHTNLVALVNIVAQDNEPLVIYELVRQACAMIGFNTTWQALQAEGWTEQQLSDLQRAWERADLVRDMAASFEMERAMTLDSFQQMKESNATLRFVVGQREGWEMPLNSFATSGFILKWINVPLWRVAWADQDEVRQLNRWQAIIEHERQARSNSWAALMSGTNDIQEVVPWSLLFPDESEIRWYDRFRFLFSAGPFGISDSLIGKTLSLQTQKRMTTTVIAIKRFQVQNGSVPNELNALVPTYLAELPRDDLGGGVLRYRAVSQTNFVLYSVGKDGVDDAGDPSLSDKSKQDFRQIWDGKDALWPTAATPEEEARTMQPGRKRR